MFTGWGTVANGSHPFQQYDDVRTEDLGAGLNQGQKDGSIHLNTAQISRSTLRQRKNRSTLNLEARVAEGGLLASGPRDPSEYMDL